MIGQGTQAEACATNSGYFARSEDFGAGGRSLTVAVPCWSPIQLQRKLNLARSPLEQQRRPRAGDRSHRRVTNLCIRIIELGRVQNIKSFCAELKPASAVLAEVEVFEE